MNSLTQKAAVSDASLSREGSHVEGLRIKPKPGILTLPLTPEGTCSPHSNHTEQVARTFVSSNLISIYKNPSRLSDRVIFWLIFFTLLMGFIFKPDMRPKSLSGF